MYEISNIFPGSQVGPQGRAFQAEGEHMQRPGDMKVSIAQSGRRWRGKALKSLGFILKPVGFAAGFPARQGFDQISPQSVEDGSEVEGRSDSCLYGPREAW